MATHPTVPLRPRTQRLADLIARAHLGTITQEELEQGMDDLFAEGRPAASGEGKAA